MTRLSATIRARNTRLIRSSPAQYLSTRNRPESNQNEASAPTSNTHLYSIKSSISATPFHTFREGLPGVVPGRPRPRPWPMQDLRRWPGKGTPPEPRRAAGGPVAPSDRSPSSTPARPGSAGPRGRRRSRATLPNPTRPGRRATGSDAPRAADTRPDTPGAPPECLPLAGGLIQRPARLRENDLVYFDLHLLDHSPEEIPLVLEVVVHGTPRQTSPLDYLPGSRRVIPTLREQLPRRPEQSPPRRRPSLLLRPAPLIFLFYIHTVCMLLSEGCLSSGGGASR